VTFINLSYFQCHPFFLLFQESLVAISVPEFANLPFIPTGDFGEIAGNPCYAIHVLRSTVSTGGTKAPARPIAAITGGELRREGDLVILSQLESFNHKIGQR
jgi:hypothetical protein